MSAPVRERTPRSVWLAAATLTLALAATADRYGYHRDELYFRMLPPAWGYLDQPPLTPLLARSLASVVDEPWALRIPAILAAAATVLVVAATCREVGGGRRAQALAAWGTAAAVMPLSFGHVLLTASLDMALWPAIVLCAVRAIQRDDGRWWLVAGGLAGAGLYNKLLVIVLLAALAVGLLVAGPRSVLRSRQLWAGVAIAVVIGSPNLVYQVLNGLPQLAMGQALGDENAAEVRIMMWPFLALLLGPLLVPTWVAGVVALLRRPDWSRLRFLVIAFVAVLAFTFWAGAQTYYPLGLVLSLYAIGCVPVTEWVADRRARAVVVAAAVAVNAVVAAVVSLPLVPVSVLGRTPIPEISQLVADQVGWPEYAQQIGAVAAEHGADAVIVSNYGEAGALDRYGSGGAPVVSGHNALAYLTRPPDDADTVVVAGGQYPAVAGMFSRCEVLAELDNGIGVDNEEQGQPVAVCTGPVAPWDELWPRFEHWD